jgi:L-alanine-DL-glutamate epimerase-like enolase superfamily enzyme
MPLPITGSEVRAYTVPTEAPESDGTLEWDSTTLVLVRLQAGDRRGLGYTYGHPSLAALVRDQYLPLLENQDAFAPGALTEKLVRASRNLGPQGGFAMAISAVDVALWDLKARAVGLPLADLLGRRRPRVPAYWSGGFTSSPAGAVYEEFADAARQGFTRFKMKVGRDPPADGERVSRAREAIGPAGELYVDANGAFAEGAALEAAELYARHRVSWFEEPVPADDVSGLARVRARLPPGLELATGEYGWDSAYFLRLVAARAADVLQPDATRCGGVTGFLAAAAVCEAAKVPYSSHTAPSLHAHLDAAAPGPFRHLEYFRDHVRLEGLLFEGAARAVGGSLIPAYDRPGLGLELKEAEAERFRV